MLRNDTCVHIGLKITQKFHLHKEKSLDWMLLEVKHSCYRELENFGRALQVWQLDWFMLGLSCDQGPHQSSTGLL